LGIVEFAGVTAIDTRVAGVTAKVALLDTPPKLAEMPALPGLAEVARPCDPAALLTVATLGVVVAQVAVVVRFCVELSV